MYILGVRVDNLTKNEILEKIEGFLGGNKFHQIATVNPEFILAARKDKEFKDILNSCDLNVADGAGLKFAFWKQGFQKLKCRIAGIDLMWEILKIANENSLGVYLVASSEGLSSWEETAEAVKKIYPNLKIYGANLKCHSGLDPESSQKKLGYILDSRLRGNDNNNIENFNILFCNFGHPYQEKFIYSLKAGDYAKIKLAMGVGGSFDFATGKLCRAPLWMRKIGLEWLFRLIQQPKRIKRIFNAVIVFPTKIIFKK